MRTAAHLLAAETIMNNDTHLQLALPSLTLFACETNSSRYIIALQ